jgi:hypothetical protein
MLGACARQRAHARTQQSRNPLSSLKDATTEGGGAMWKLWWLLCVVVFMHYGATIGGEIMQQEMSGLMYSENYHAQVEVL